MLSDQTVELLTLAINASAEIANLYLESDVMALVSFKFAFINFFYVRNIYKTYAR